MAITFYYGSGSPFAWYVWLVLEHKQLAYEFKLMSLLGDDLKTPDFRVINPRGKVPVLLDGDQVFRESTAIVEYLEEVYGDRPLLSADPGARALARRMVAEADTYLYPPIRRLMEQTVFRTDGNGDRAVIEQALEDLQRELDYWAATWPQEFFVNALSIADFKLYPLLALVNRLRFRQPDLTAALAMPAPLTAFMTRIEQLPYFAKTIPPHWQQ